MKKTNENGPVKQPGPNSYGFGGYGPTAFSADKPAKPPKKADKSDDSKPAKKRWGLFGRS